MSARPRGDGGWSYRVSVGMTRERRHAVGAAYLGVALMLAYAIAMVLQILVWNPLAAVPGRTLEQIQADMAAAGEGSPAGDVMVFAVAAMGVALAVALTIATIVERRPDPRRTAAGVGTILAFGAPAYFVASFGRGMGLADTYGIGGGDASNGAVPLLVASAAGLLVACVFGGWTLHRSAILSRPIPLD